MYLRLCSLFDNNMIFYEAKISYQREKIYTTGYDYFNTKILNLFTCCMNYFINIRCLKDVIITFCEVLLYYRHILRSVRYCYIRHTYCVLQYVRQTFQGTHPTTRVGPWRYIRLSNSPPRTHIIQGSAFALQCNAIIFFNTSSFETSVIANPLISSTPPPSNYLISTLLSVPRTTKPTNNNEQIIKSPIPVINSH